MITRTSNVDECAIIGSVLVVPLDSMVLFWDMASDRCEAVPAVGDGEHVSLKEFYSDSAVTFLPMAKA